MTIVERIEDEAVHTIEGNTSNSCARRSYRLDGNVIRGYGTSMYKNKTAREDFMLLPPFLL